MEQFLTYLISPLLNTPDKLVVNVMESTVTVEVDPGDVGRLIGKHGSVVHSLRVLLKTYCSLHQLPQVTLVLNTPPLVSPETKTD